LILELQDKFRKELAALPGGAAATGVSGSGYNTVRDEALSALVTLGISRPAAEKSIDKALSEWQKQYNDAQIRLEELIKLALKTT